MLTGCGSTCWPVGAVQVLGEAMLSPAIPSVAARAGGIFFPLAKVRSFISFQFACPFAVAHCCLSS